MKDLRGPVHFLYPLHLFKTLQNIFSFFLAEVHRSVQVAPRKIDIHGVSLTWDACEGVSTHQWSQATHLLSWHNAHEQRNTISDASQVLNSLFQLHPSAQEISQPGMQCCETQRQDKKCIMIINRTLCAVFEFRNRQLEAMGYHCVLMRNVQPDPGKWGQHKSLQDCFSLYSSVMVNTRQSNSVTVLRINVTENNENKIINTFSFTRCIVPVLAVVLSLLKCQKLSL